MKLVALSGLSRNAGGVFYAVSSLCKALNALGIQIVAMGDGQDLSESDKAIWKPIQLKPYRAVGPLRTAVGLRKELARSGADLVHQHGLWQDDQWASLQWEKKRGNPVVISPHGMLDPWAVRNSAWKKKLVGKLFADESLKKASCIHALCQSEADSIRAYGLKNPIAIIPNGIVLPDLMTNQAPPVSGVKRKLLFLGRIHPKKGLKELLQAWAKAKSLKPHNFSDWQLLIVGWDDGGYENGLRTLGKELGIEASVEFIGSKFGAEKEALLREVDAFILPSFSEGLPMSVLEAWSFGVPVVMTEFCNLPEGFVAEAALKIVPDVESIARGLCQLTEMEPSELALMGQSGRSLVEKKFTWEKIAQNMKTVYEQCISGSVVSL